MMNPLFLLLVFALVRDAPSNRHPGDASAATCISAEEKKMYDLLMAYRAEKGLKPIPLSAQLTLVAQTHAKDLATNYKFSPDGRCNPHSWSDKGSWSSCCYTSDHKQAKCMWDKPMEIAGYDSPGYEIAYYSSGGATAAGGIEGWKTSPSHNTVMLNEGTWAKAEWKAVGMGLYGQYGVIWFGQMPDESALVHCPNP